MAFTNKLQMGRRIFLAGVGAALPIAFARAAEPGRTDAQMQKDWPWLGRYEADNHAVIAAGKPTTIVFMGDSITEGWRRERPAFFREGWLDRGISGQTTPQMVLRMMADVVAHRPRLVHILGGTNDVAENTGPISPDQTVANIHMMISIARQAGIGVLIGAVPPAATFAWRPDLSPARTIEALNAKLQGLARETGSGWVDYHRVLDDGRGGIGAAFSGDGVHPNAAGYAVMERLAEAAIAARRRHVPSAGRQ